MAETKREKSAPSPILVVDSQPMERASELLGDVLLEHLHRNATARLAIPGGTALAALARARARLGDAWRRVALTWVDERCVPVSDAESNRGGAARLGLISAGNWQAIEPEPSIVLPLFEDGETPAQSISRVESRLASDFGGALDVVLLGMGSDGHIASLFPSLAMPAQGLVAHIPNSPKPPRNRVTLTRTLLATAKHVILLATGEAKRDPVQRLVAGEAKLPAQGLPGLVIVTDHDLDVDAETNWKGG